MLHQIAQEKRRTIACRVQRFTPPFERIDTMGSVTVEPESDSEYEEWMPFVQS